MSESLSETSSSPQRETESSSPMIAVSPEWIRLRGDIRDRLAAATQRDEARLLAALELLLTVAPIAELALIERNEDAVLQLWNTVRNEVIEILDRPRD